MDATINTDLTISNIDFFLKQIFNLERDLLDRDLRLMALGFELKVKDELLESLKKYCLKD